MKTRLVIDLRKAAGAAKPRPKAAPAGGRTPQSRGLVLRPSKHNPRVKRWERMGEPKEEPKPPSGDVQYRHPQTGQTRTGSVHAGGAKGITVVDHETGQQHKVHHGHYVEHQPEGDAAAQAGKKAKKPAKAKGEGRDFRKEMPGLSRYPPKGVSEAAVEEGGPKDNWRLRWRHPKTGQVQLAYDEAFLKERARKKFAKMKGFGQSLPAFRSAVREHLDLPMHNEHAVLAAMATIVDSTYMRAGGRSAETFGVSTLKHEHASVHGDEVVFTYTGKAGVPQRKVLQDPKVARLVQHMLETAPPGRLFQHKAADGSWTPITASALRDYIKTSTGGGSTKDFRTWHATRIFSEAADKLGAPKNDADAERKIRKAAMVVAAALGHRKGKVHRQFVRVDSSSKAHEKAAKAAGGEGYGAGVFGFHTAKDRKAFQASLNDAEHIVLTGDNQPPVEHRKVEWQTEHMTALNAYIDPTVVEAFRKGVTLSGSDMKKGGSGGLTASERRFAGYLARVEKADVWGTEWAPKEGGDE